MKIGDPIMRVFTYGDNWVGIITWCDGHGVVQVKWSHEVFIRTHHLSVLTLVKKCP
jgi:hypothetical protein